MSLSRRTLLASPAALLACARRKATGFQGYCFVANQEGRTLAVVDLTNFRVRKQIPLDAAPAAILPHPAKPKAFVLAPDAGTVYEIDVASLSVSRRVRAGAAALDMRLAPDRSALWVLYRDPAVLVELPLDSLRPARRIRLASPAGDFDLSVRDNLAAITSPQDHSIALASLSKAAVVRTIAAGAEPGFVRFRSDAQQVIVANRRERGISVFDVPSGKTVVRLPLPVEPANVCLHPNGGQMFIAGLGMDAVVVYFPYRTEIWQTVLAGRAPQAMAIAETNPSYLLVSNPDTNSVTVLDLDSLKLAALVQVGQRPGHILITPDRQYALVLNQQSGDMAVIRLYSLGAAQSERVRRYKSAPLFTLIPVGERPVSAAVVSWT